ncbi:glycerate kinase [Micromonas pusilla CCMP1545]|uniref:Glycerate kinase n=1 Tax=Micromonas pusilla (strain CCMP1545) TaxID=564608 RepID=C1N2V1_MICPC|nr:glycerate kinase [Micromonas pusilla CCMP1545]EEH53654.1 glycerate kinase [Micromonas pusilla CCMP1545]|eukprot:XP_003061942.1 glycerate kinase [Micromonas pusilla CCMP1545]
MSSSGGDEIETPPSPSDVDAVRAYVTTGPLFPQLEMRDRDVTETRVAEWIALVAELCDVLGFDAHSMDDAQASRTYRYYLPVYLWTEARILAHVDAYQTPQRSRDPPPPLVVGLSAPQGCGKTTVVSTLVKLLERRGTRAASLSIDDVYLTGAEQDALAAANPTNALLRFRGNAGSHDVGLGVETLRALRDVNGVRGDGGEARGAVRVPRYDKTMRGGRGDRAPVDAWPEVQAPLDVGWMLGFTPIGPDACDAIDPDLVAVDASLSNGGYDALSALVDAWVVVKVADAEWVRAWRLQAERQTRAEGRPTLSDDEVSDFVDRFMPAYVAYLPGLYARGPDGGGEGGGGGGGGSGKKPTLVVEVDERRNVR